MQGIVWKIHSQGDKLLIAMCDEAVLDKHLKLENLDVWVNPRFFNGSLFNAEEFEKLLPKVFSINAFGERAVKFLIDKGLVDPSQIRVIDNVPHAIIVLF